MIRRTVRERREYIYRRSLIEKDKAAYELKKKIKKAIEEGKPLPNELKKSALELHHSLTLDDADTEIPRSLLDDEYGRAGITDPRIVITTSCSPSSKLRVFAKELKLVIPNAERLNRGNHTPHELVATGRANGITDLIVLHEHRGIPVGMIISHLPYGPTAYFGIYNCILRHEVPDKKTISLVYPHLIFDGFSTQLGNRVSTILKHLFPVPKEESKRILSFSNKDDFISFRHHVYEQDGADLNLKEIGPRYELRLYQIKLGTLEQQDADIEWVLRPFMNSAKRKNFL